MMTSGDRTVGDCLDVFDEVAGLGLRHIGFKDVGVSPDVLETLNRRIKEAGATSYLEVVSLTPASTRQSARVARRLGVDRVLGGGDVEAVMEEIGGAGIEYFPFAGRPQGHPTALLGSTEEIAADCRRADQLGCAGVDLLAFRSIVAPPLDLVRAARRVLRGRLIVAGSVDSPGRVKELGGLDVDAFTIGTALFERRFLPGEPSLRAQVAAALAAGAT
ncbi:MAG TPA: hypothetical protein VN823_28610 [Stellaceae bacterium]|nr:hypothetical protein [Stellaceae bacterium]